jgi:tetratricopeptide (TPR) repeat protein
VSTAGALAHARAYVENRRWQEALAILAPFVASEPDNPEAWRLITRCQYGLNNFSAAESAATTALTLDPSSEWGHRLYSLVLTAQKSYAAAERAAEASIRLGPNLWMAHVNRANVDLARKQVTPRTLQAAQDAVRLGPNEPEAHTALGRVALAGRRNKAAKAAFRQALRLDPNFATARNNLAVAQLREHNLAAAGKNFLGALRQNPDSALFASNLRVVLRAWGSLYVLALVIGSIVISSVTNGHTITTSTAGVALPVPDLTPSSVGIADLPTSAIQKYTQAVPIEHTTHIAVLGRPPGLTITVAVVLTLGLLIAASIRRTIGSGAPAIVRSAVRVDRAARALGVASTLGTVLLLAAAGFGQPAAHDLSGITSVSVIIAVFAAQIVVRRDRKRRMPDLRRH